MKKFEGQHFKNGDFEGTTLSSEQVAINELIDEHEKLKKAVRYLANIIEAGEWINRVENKINSILNS